MSDKKSKPTQKLGVKAYSELIGKSDKTVYKMIKDGLLPVKKGKSGFEVIVDAYVVEAYSGIKKELAAVSDLVKELSKRLSKVEANNLKKKTLIKKVNSPVKKSVKKTVSKSVSKKKPSKKTIKK